MNVPLNWLADYVKLPKDTAILTDKLTNIGHMLDKTKEIAGDAVIDLELRGNRPDLLGLVGVAREVAAAFNTPLKLPPIKPLPKKDPASPLVKVDTPAEGLVHRYTALRLAVKVGPSPKWLVQRLANWGVPTINNVVDITNYVMIETGQPLHAFDYHKIKGGQLILRRAKPREKFQTIQQGLSVVLSTADLVITDKAGPQALTMIGGLHSKVTNQTTEILLESAVYDQANCRRSSRRLKIFTDSSVRHEKLLDPRSVEFALTRAYYLLAELTAAKPLNGTSDYYPKPAKSPVINFQVSEIARLGGIDIPLPTIINILQKLEFAVTMPKVTPPYFRTDINQSADVVEEVLRIHGYDNIPATPLSGMIPAPMTYPSFKIQETLRDHLTKFGLDEVITLSMISTKHQTDRTLSLVNPPDPDLAVLRPSLIPGLLAASQHKSIVGYFEIGKVFSAGPTEQLNLGITVSTALPNLKGILDALFVLLGVSVPFTIGQQGSLSWAELNVDKLLELLPPYAALYSIVSLYPPIIEDVNIPHTDSYANIVTKIKSLSDLITKIDLVDKFGDKLTLRLYYHSPDRQLSSSDIAPIRQQLTSLFVIPTEVEESL